MVASYPTCTSSTAPRTIQGLKLWSGNAHTHTHTHKQTDYSNSRAHARRALMNAQKLVKRGVKTKGMESAHKSAMMSDTCTTVITHTVAAKQEQESERHSRVRVVAKLDTESH